MLDHAEGETCGENVVENLLGESNYLLLGRSGLGKSFHLQHLARRASKQEEIPILVEARHLKGDFTLALRRAVGPYTEIEPRVFLDSIRKCALKPLLVVDGITGREPFVPDLLKDILAFQVQCESRVIIGSQHEFHLPGGFTAHPVNLAPLTPEHKRAIYSFHAGIADTPDLEQFCEAFGTAFDLTIAGRVHADARKSLTRAELYGLYCRKILPAHYSAVAASALRDLARQLSINFVSSISLHEFERCVEASLKRSRGSLHVLDELRGCRLLTIGDDMVSFQHDLLKDYFLAEAVWRDRVDLVQLGEELSKPANQDLIEFILPKYTSSSDIKQLLRSVNSGDFLLDILKGKAGSKARQVLREECNVLIDNAIQDLGSIELTFQTFEDSDEKRRVGSALLSGTRQWSAHEAQLCSLFARSLDDEQFRDRFFTLLDLAEQTLRAATDRVAQRLKISVRAAWGELIRENTGVLIGGKLQLPLERIMSCIRMNAFPHRARQLARDLYDGLVDRAMSAPRSDFALSLILELVRWDQPTDVDVRVKLLEIAAESRIHILWVQAVAMIQSCSAYVAEERPEARRRIIEILEGMLESVRVDTIGILEALSGFGAMDPPVPLEGALDEFRRAARGELSEHDLFLISLEPKQSRDQFLADTAYGLLSRIFEDIFQGVYSEAYDSLDEGEKVSVLCRAGMAAEAGFHISWILEQLIANGSALAAPIYQRFASFLDKDSPFRQDAVGALILGIAGWATISAEPCRLEGQETPDLRAWGLVAQMLFWMFRLESAPGKARIESLWKCLNREAPLAAADVFYEISVSGGFSELRKDVHGKLMRLLPNETRKMLDTSLSNKDSLTSLFRVWQGRDIERLRFVIDSLGEFGIEANIELLKSSAEDARVGAAAIAAIKKIRNRERGFETTR
ncbi:hypothetical protein [Candidatus Binatus sp.]|uniref:hypothetical protein n=1 Tax=Candidatus Binatus sp. TaxID=2811406 RepID=UPI003BB04769